MSGFDGENEADSRRARINRLKKIILITIGVLVILPNLLCVILFIRLAHVNRKLDGISESLRKLETEYAIASRKEQDDSSGQQSQTDTEPYEDAQNRKDPVIIETITQNQNNNEEIDQQPETVSTDHAHLVYLTFDDGPSIYTDEILDILAEYDVKATFFVVGKETEKDQERIKRIVEEGHTLGMHSYSHKYDELYATLESFTSDFQKIRSYLYDVTGVTSMYYRFPGGSSNSVSQVDMQELIAYLGEQGVTYFDWNISSGDAENKGYTMEELVDNSTRNIVKYHTSVVLLHDSAAKHSTVEALPQIIENILAMEDTVILPITEDTTPVQHKMK